MHKIVVLVCNISNEFHSVRDVMQLTFSHYDVVLRVVRFASRAECSEPTRYAEMAYD